MKQNFHLLKSVNSDSAGSACRPGHAVVRMEAAAVRRGAISPYGVVVELDLNAGVRLNIDANSVFAVVIDIVFVDKEFQTVLDGVGGKDVKPVAAIVSRVIALDDHGVQSAVFRADKVESVQSVIQKVVVRDSQVLNAGPLAQ